jgi:hypothetical protein
VSAPRLLAAPEAGTAFGVGIALTSCAPDQLEVVPIHRYIDGRELGSACLPGYIERDHDRHLRERVARAAAGESQIATLISHSTAGKKRAMYEAITAVVPGQDTPLLADWRVFPGMSPEEPDTLLSQIASVVPRTVLWLPGAE